MHKIIIYDIPKSNNEYMGRGSRGSNFKYQDDKRDWAWKVKAAVGRNKPVKPYSNVIVRITYHFPTKHRRDPDNYSGKFLLDGLVNAGVLEDDSFDCIDLQLEGKHDKDNPRTEITIKESI